MFFALPISCLVSVGISFIAKSDSDKVESTVGILLNSYTNVQISKWIAYPLVPVDVNRVKSGAVHNTGASFSASNSTHMLIEPTDYHEQHIRVASCRSRLESQRETSTSTPREPKLLEGDQAEHSQH